MFLEKLTGKASLYAIGGITVVSGLIIGAQQLKITWLNDDVKSKNSTITILTSDLAVAEANVATLKNAVDRQNQALQRLRAEKLALDAQVREKALKAVKDRKESAIVDGQGVDSMNQFFERLFR